jgi:hypothetical protein
MFYGGIHATSWNDHFPSNVEQTMWRLGACGVMGGGIAVCILACLLRHGTRTVIWPLGQGGHYEGRTKCQERIAIILLVMIKVLTAGFSGSRGFLVLEAFMSLRSLPLGAYSTVDWASFLPHVT